MLRLPLVVIIIVVVVVIVVIVVVVVVVIVIAISRASIRLPFGTVVVIRVSLVMRDC